MSVSDLMQPQRVGNPINSIAPQDLYQYWRENVQMPGAQSGQEYPQFYDWINRQFAGPSMPSGTNLGTDYAVSGQKSFDKPLVGTNPATGQVERLYENNNSPIQGWDDSTLGHYFASDPTKPSTAVPSLAGGMSYGGPMTWDEKGILAGLAAITGGAAGAALGAGAAGAGELGAAGAGGAGAGAADAGVYGVSGIESAAAPGFTYGGGAAAGLGDAGAVAGASGFPTLAGSVGADTLGGGTAGATMPAAVPPSDPTFGGALSQTAPGAYEDLGGMGAGYRTDLPVASAPGYSTPMSRILDGSANTADWLSIGGTLGATGLGIFGANRQQNALQNQYNQYLGLGAPSRARYEASFQPGFRLTDIPGFQDAMNTTTDTLLRRASMGGNPAGNPAALAEINKYVAGNLALPTLENYRNQNAATGGYGAFNTAAPATGAAAINAGAGSLNSLGYGINQLANPMPTLDQLFRQAQGSQQQPRSLG